MCATLLGPTQSSVLIDMKMEQRASQGFRYLREERVPLYIS